MIDIPKAWVQAIVTEVMKELDGRYHEYSDSYLIYEQKVDGYWYDRLVERIMREL